MICKILTCDIIPKMWRSISVRLLRLSRTFSDHRPASNWSLLTLCEDNELEHGDTDQLDEAWRVCCADATTVMSVTH